VIDVPDLDTIRDRVARAEPRVTPEARLRGWQAATALILAPGADGAELAFIERVERHGDPWSGHMALPGGKRDPEDPDLAATAARETREEVGLALPGPIGRLDDQPGGRRGRRRRSPRRPLDDRPAMTPHPEECADALWIPLASLLDPRAAGRHRFAGMPFPGLTYDGRTIWGLTLGTLGTFADTIGVRLPVRHHRPRR